MRWVKQIWQFADDEDDDDDDQRQRVAVSYTHLTLPTILRV